MWIEGETRVDSIVRDLANVLIAGGWSLHYPQSVGNIDQVAVLKTTTTPAGPPGAQESLTAYLEIKRPDPDKNFHYVEVRASDRPWDPVEEDFPEDTASVPARWHWLKPSVTTVRGWYPVSYWATVNNDRAAIVLMGDPSVDFNGYLSSFAYFGSIEPFADSDLDVKGNFAVSVSSATPPPQSTQYGDRTASGVTDIAMLASRAGFPWQAHYPAFATPWQFYEKHYLGPSRWTHKYHMSPVWVVHGSDNYRGKLRDVLVCDRSGIVHLDELIVDRGLPTEKVYKFFNVNAPYSLLNNSPNVLYGIVLLKE